METLCLVNTIPWTLACPSSYVNPNFVSFKYPRPKFSGARHWLPCLQVSVEEADMDTREASLPRVIAVFHYFPKMACFLSHQSWLCLILSLGGGPICVYF